MDDLELPTFYLYPRPPEQLIELVVVFDLFTLDDPIVPSRSVLNNMESPSPLRLDGIDASLCRIDGILERLLPAEALGKLCWLAIKVLLG